MLRLTELNIRLERFGDDVAQVSKRIDASLEKNLAKFGASLQDRHDAFFQRCEEHQKRVEDRQGSLEGVLKGWVAQIQPQKKTSGSRGMSLHPSEEFEGCVENKSVEGVSELYGTLEMRQEARLKGFQNNIECLIAQQLKRLEVAVCHLQGSEQGKLKVMDMDERLLETSEADCVPSEGMCAKGISDDALAQPWVAGLPPRLERASSGKSLAQTATDVKSGQTAEQVFPQSLASASAGIHVHHGASSADMIAFAKPSKPSNFKQLFKAQSKHVHDEHRNCLQVKIHSFVFHPTFEFCVGVVIILNAIFLGIAMEADAERALRSEPTAIWEYIGEVAFAALFSVELILRVLAEGVHFFTSPHWRWHLFDGVVVTSSLLSVVGDTMNLSAIRCLRIFRMAKIMRVLRVVTYLRELRLMLDSLYCCGMSLFWALVLLGLVIFLFACFLAEARCSFLRDEHGPQRLDPDINQGLREYHGSLTTSMIFLAIAVVGGGVDWYDIALPYVQMNWLYGFAFICFVFGILLGMLNVLTGIFVDSATHISALDEELVIEQVEADKLKTINHIKHIFRELDKDSDGLLTPEEMRAVIESEHIHGFLKSIDIEPSQAKAFFEILDADHNGLLSIDEFMSGCLRIKGGAKSLDLAIMMTDNKRLDIKVHDLLLTSRGLLERFLRMERALGIVPSTSVVDSAVAPTVALERVTLQEISM